MDIILTIVIVIVAILLFGAGLYSYYNPYFDIIEDIDGNKVFIVWYNKYTREELTREHKILYDTGRNKN